MSVRILWRTICALDEILPDTGVAAVVGTEQIAVFRIGESVLAIGNRDPFSGANVLSRGIVGDLAGKIVVASPIYKQHFVLADGSCLEDVDVSVPTYRARVYKGAVQIGTEVLSVSASHARQRLVMVGNGMAGMRVIEELLRVAPDAYDITIFGAESDANYNRILLSSLLAGEISEQDLVLHDQNWYAEQGIALHLNDAVLSIDRVRREVRSASGRTVGYDRLLLATGSTPNRLRIAGSELPGVVTFRDLKDVAAMRARTGPGTRAVVIGGGLLGLEAAHGLNQHGCSVTVVHSSSILMERQLDAFAATLLRESLESRGIRFRLASKTEALEGTDQVNGVRFTDGSVLEADLVVCAIGVAANVALARSAGLQIGRGIVVDDTLQTFDPRIYAVGECTEHRKQTYGLVAPLYEQARVCAAHLAGAGHLRYAGSQVATSLKVTGIGVFCAGDQHAEGAQELVLRDASAGVYKRLLVRERTLVAVLLVGDTADSAWYQQLLSERADVGAFQDRLVFGRAQVELPVAA